MVKKIIISLLCLFLLLSFCSCQYFANIGKTNKIDTSAQKELMKEVEELCGTAALQYDVGLTFQSEYVYGLALAEISSLRLCVDRVLWLRGEGRNFAEVAGDAPYKSWDEIVGAGLGSDAPFYFEGLLLKFQGETEASEECFKRAAYNPLHKERDFYYLRKISVKELYELKEEASALEKRVLSEYTPRTALLSERTGAEFSPAYHLAVASGCDNEADALQSAINALLSDPLSPSLYGSAALYAMNAGNIELAFEILNDGLFLAPEDASVNYTAAVLSLAKGDGTAAKTFIETAKKTAGAELLSRINALDTQTGG